MKIVHFFCCVIKTKRTTYVSKEGEAVYDPMRIAKNYLKGWFTIDAIAAMPYDLILFGSGNIDVICTSTAIQFSFFIYFLSFSF
jgi:potassium voltage-gated channel Eag-related subfamily H member 2